MARITPFTAEVQRTVLLMKDRLAQASIDEIVEHRELRAMMPSSIVGRIDHYVLAQRAQRLLNAENGAVFATVRREGYRRLANTVGANYTTNTALVRIRRQSRRGQKMATLAIQFANDSTDSERRQVFQKLATLGLIEHLTLAKTVKTMPEEPQPTDDPLDGLRRLLNIVR